MNQQEWNRLSYGERAWKLYLIMHYLNDESGYYSGWLYIWPDGERYEDCLVDFEDKESYDELERSFKGHYGDKEIHDAGLYSNKPIPQSIIDDAHFWDEQLGLDPIEVIKPCSWF